MLISELYQNKLKKLAGICIIKEEGLIKKKIIEEYNIEFDDNFLLTEATEQERQTAFAASDSRVPFNADLMARAIKEGREIGMLFQSDNEKYKMPVAKYRIIYPVAMGISKAGNLVIRGFHKIGQSERKARETKVRSAEVENAWRLFKSKNIKGMWFTGNFFRGPLEGYNAQDKGMVVVHVSTNFNEVKRIQDKLFKDIENRKGLENKNILKTFNNIEEEPEVQNISQTLKQPVEKIKNLFKGK